MSRKLFIERREECDYAIRKPDAERISGHERTQAEAIGRAKEIDPDAAILVERVRNTDRGIVTNGVSLSCVCTSSNACSKT